MAKIDPTLSNVLARQLLLQALGLAKKMVPPLTDMLSEMALSKVGDVFKTSDDCPSQLRMLQLIELRNNLLNVLNPVSKTVKSIKDVLPKISTVIDTINIAITATEIAIITAEGTLTVTTPAAGAQVTAINIAQKIVDNLKPVLTVTEIITSSLELVVPIVDSIVTKIIDMLNALDLKLIDCGAINDPNQLKSIDPYFVKIYEATKAQQAQQSQQAQTPSSSSLSYTKANTTYKGFTLEAITGSYIAGPNSPKIPQLKGIGKNVGGITLLETEWSFTTNPVPLIEELKFKIDKENLIAY